MALDPRLIIQQQGNPLASHSQGVQTRAAHDGIARENNRHAFLQDNAAGIFSGDQNALSGYAQFDPQAALAIQGQHQQMRLRDEANQRAKAASARAAVSARRAAMEAKSKEDLIAKQTELRRDLALADMANGSGQWEAYVAENDKLPEGTTYEDVKSLGLIALGEFDKVAGVYNKPGVTPQVDLPDGSYLANPNDPSSFQYFPGQGPQPAENNTPAAVQTLQFRANAAGLTEGTPEYQEFMQTGGRSGPLVSVQSPAPAPPKGYQNVFDENNNLVGQEPIPGGPAETEVKLQAKKSLATLNSLEQQWSTVERSIDKAIEDMSALNTGLGAAALGGIPGTGAYDYQRTLETIKANIGFDKLQDMRDNSPTGGALGQVSEFENRLLQSVRGSLDPNQSQDQLRNNLLNIQSDLRALQEERRRAYSATYGDTESTAPVQIDGYTIEIIQ